MALDDLGAPFGTAWATSRRPQATRRWRRGLRGFLAPEPAWRGLVSAAALARGEGEEAEPETAPLSVQITHLQRPVEVRGSHLALAEGGVKATWRGREACPLPPSQPAGSRDPGRRRRGAELAARGVAPGSSRRLIGERKTLLGSVGEGAFGRLCRRYRLRGCGREHRIGRGGGSAPTPSMGGSPRRRAAGWSPGCPLLSTSAFALHATRALAGSGALRLSVSQPLRVESGRGIVDGAGGPDQGGRGGVQHGAGGSCAQRPADGYRGSVAPAAGQGRASAGRRLQPPART